MATLGLAVLKNKILINNQHKIRITLSHRSRTTYIVTNIIIEKLSQFKNGQIIKHPEASVLNAKLRNVRNTYQDKDQSKSSLTISIKSKKTRSSK